MAYKFTPEVRKKIIDALRSGATQRLAAEYAGIHRDTLADWLKQAEKDGEDSEFHEFYIEYHQARGEQAKLLLDRIENIGNVTNSWQAMAWKLEHSYVRDFGRSVFGGDPAEIPEIRHVIEVKRDEGPAALIEEPNVPLSRLSSGNQDAQDTDFVVLDQESD